MSIGWEFPPNGGGRSDGFNDGALDTFAGQRLSAMVREIIQNSLDAKGGGCNGPVKVYFSLEKVTRNEFHGIEELSQHIKACKETAIEQDLPQAQDFYQSCLSSIEDTPYIPTLVISDSNTSGLTGPLDKQKGSWFALTKGAGITQKNNSSSLGSYGHGSKAPFLMAKLRTLFYLSKIENNGKVENRFQGKSILQSHYHPKKKETTQGTGFYGFKNKLAPLLNEDIPKWALELREKHSVGAGTSILIPYSRFNEELFPETKITVIANFFYAIRQGNLSVVIDGEEVNKGNVEEYFNWCKVNIEDEQDEINVAAIQDCLKSIETVVNPTYKGTIDIPKFGKIKWYIRMDNTVESRTVSIARESGMLITRKPPKLLRFPNTKPFEMFVFVSQGVGSETLKRLENPEHDNFQFDRVKHSSDYKNVINTYERLSKKVRELLNEFAKTETEQEEVITELGKYMFDATLEGNNSDASERGTTITVSKGYSTKKRQQQKLKDKIVKKKDRDSGYPIGKRRESLTPTRSRGSSIGPVNEMSIQLEDIRVIPVGKRGQTNQIKLWFSTAQEGDFDLLLYRISETNEKELIPISINGEVKNSKPINLIQGRQSVVLDIVNPSDVNFALEAWVNEI